MTRKFRVSRESWCSGPPNEDRGQEEQQHDLAIEPNVAELRNQTQQCAQHDQQNRGAHAITPAQDRAHDHRGKQRNDYDKPKHQHIILYEGGSVTTETS